jgi:hypothetical protein
VSHFPLLRRAATIGVAGVLLVACGGGSDEARPTATIAPERTSASSTTTTVDLTPPDAIDAAYLDRVMARADTLLQAAFAEGGDLQEALGSVYTSGQAAKLAGQVSALGPGGVADPPGLPTTKVRDVVAADPDCVFFTAERDLTPLVAKPFQQVQPYWLQLVPEPTDADFPWRLAGDTYYADGSAPANACP